MNGGGTDHGRHRRILGPPPNRPRIDRDEDLLLFREMHKREKDRVISLLQPVSDEFEANGNYPLYRMASAKKGLGYEFLAEGEKNDYDWLKTPPATPLFPSLEMEANAPEFVVQREIPIIQPLSRFSGNSESTKGVAGNIGSSKSPKPKPKPKVPPSRSVISSERPSFSLLETKNTKYKAIIPKQKILNQSSMDMIHRGSSTSVSGAISSAKPMNIIQKNNSKPKSRGVVSPSPMAPVGSNNIQAPGIFADHEIAPPNLRTDRSRSASRGRPAGAGISLNIPQKQQPAELSTKAIIRRQSCSPSVTRGRKVYQQKQQLIQDVEHKVRIQTTAAASSITTASGRTQVLGSRMVDKFMNARKSSAQVRETSPKLRGGGCSINESSGFGRIMSKSSLDMALKNMDIKKVGTTTEKGSASVGSRNPTS